MFKKIVSLIFAFVLFLFLAPSVKAVACNSGRWDTDDYIKKTQTRTTPITPAFKCLWIDDSGDGNAWYSSVMESAGAGCTGRCVGAGGTNEHCRCARGADCFSKLGGKCLHKVKDADEIAKKLAADWISIAWRCPFGEDVSCYVPPKAAAPTTPETPAEPAPETPTQPVATPTAKQKIPLPDIVQPSLTLDGCCQQIVPTQGYETGAYGLNHVVQLGINIYKCILCIVGSLMMLMIVVGGFFLLTSGGDKGKVKKGIDYIKAAAIGGVIVFASFVIVNFTIKAFGAQITDVSKVKIDAGK